MKYIWMGMAYLVFALVWSLPTMLTNANPPTEQEIEHIKAWGRFMRFLLGG